ncbi:uncharacterized protein C9orf40 homolog [Ctenodactylus gundi]
MAKRRAAEPLTFHVPWKRLLLCDFSEQPPPVWIPPPGTSRPVLIRKRRIDAGAMAEPSASPSKRRDRGDSSASGGQELRSRGQEADQPARSQPPGGPRGPEEELRDARPPRGGGDDGAERTGPPRAGWGAASRQHSEEFWQYNTFQYWRNPLPPLDLADFEDVGEYEAAAPVLPDRPDTAEVDMES